MPKTTEKVSSHIKDERVEMNKDSKGLTPMRRAIPKKDKKDLFCFFKQVETSISGYKCLHTFLYFI